MERYRHLVEASIAGETLSRDDAVSVMRTKDGDVVPLLQAAFVVRETAITDRAGEVVATMRHVTVVRL